MATLPLFLMSFFISLFACTILVPLALALARTFGIYTIVNEGQCKVYVLFGKVIATLNEPGFHFLPAKLGLPAFIIHIFGKCYELDFYARSCRGPEGKVYTFRYSRCGCYLDLYK